MATRFLTFQFFLASDGVFTLFESGLKHNFTEVDFSERKRSFVFFGFNTLFLPQFWMGSHGMPRRYYNYPPEFQLNHQISTVGAFMTGFGLALHFGILIWSLWYGKKASANPWGGKTLEWTVESPPNIHNFHQIPVVDAFPYEYKPERV